MTSPNVLFGPDRPALVPGTMTFGRVIGLDQARETAAAIWNTRVELEELRGISARKRA